MSIKSWKRSRDNDPTGSSHASADSNDSTPHPTLSQLAASEPLVESDERTGQYSDWADRMREKRVRTQLMQNGAALDGSVHAAGIHWTTEGLFEESRRVDEEELLAKPNPWQVKELLAVLDLREGATTRDIGDSYRCLAKRHHPDRFVSAEDDVREYHANRMRGIIDAYTTLKSLESTSS